MKCRVCNAVLVSADVGRKRTHFCSITCRSLGRTLRFEELGFRLRVMLTTAKCRAGRLKKTFDLTLPFLKELYEEQHGCCAISGRPFVLKRGKHRHNNDSPSLDRIDPAGGYTKDNVRLTTYHANIALNIFGLDAFMELCADTTRFQTAGVL